MTKILKFPNKSTLFAANFRFVSGFLPYGQNMCAGHPILCTPGALTGLAVDRSDESLGLGTRPTRRRHPIPRRSSAA
jgi:hypothetical protein